MVSFVASLSFTGVDTFLNLCCYRGRKDRYHGDDDGTSVFRLRIFCTHFFVDSVLGYWGCVGHRGVFDDWEVSFLSCYFWEERDDV